MSKVNIVCANYDLTTNRCKLGIETLLGGACVEGYNCPKYKAEMSSEIEEMARSMCPYSKNTLCRECSDACFYKDYAERAFNAGYLKQSENLIAVVRCCDCKYCEVVINDIIDEPKYFCTRLIGCFPTDPTDYCSRARMKGGAE